MKDKLRAYKLVLENYNILKNYTWQEKYNLFLSTIKGNRKAKKILNNYKKLILLYLDEIDNPYY